MTDSEGLPNPADISSSSGMHHITMAHPSYGDTRTWFGTYPTPRGPVPSGKGDTRRAFRPSLRCLIELSPPRKLNTHKGTTSSTACTTRAGWPSSFAGHHPHPRSPSRRKCRTIRSSAAEYSAPAACATSATPPSNPSHILTLLDDTLHRDC